MSSTFDPAFYSRFYLNPRTRVTDRQEMRTRACAIAALVKQLELPVKRILDVGCGLGWMRAPLLRAFPAARYVGLEVSEHLCAQHGWTQASIASFSASHTFDLVICYDVFQYLSDAEAARGFTRLAALCCGALYFHAPTREDWQRNADRSCSDSNVTFREAAWYRDRLTRRFRYAGFGLHVRRGVSFVQWELERAD